MFLTKLAWRYDEHSGAIQAVAKPKINNEIGSFLSHMNQGGTFYTCVRTEAWHSWHMYSGLALLNLQPLSVKLYYPDPACTKCPLSAVVHIVELNVSCCGW